MATDPSRPPHAPRSTLARRILLPLAGLMALSVLVLAWIDYTFTVNQVERSTRAALLQSVRAPAMARAAMLSAAEQQAGKLADEYVRRWYRADTVALDAAFDYWFTPGADGRTAVRPELADRRRPVLQLQAGAAGDAVRRRQAALAFQLLREWGPPLLAEGLYDGSYLSLAGNGVALYAPEGGPDLAQGFLRQRLAHPIVRGAAPQANPSRQAFWTPLYFDADSGQWRMSVGVPIDLRGRWVGVAALDIAFDRLLQDTLRDAAPGTWNMLLNRDGALIAHPRLARGPLAANAPAPREPLVPLVRRYLQQGGSLPAVLDSADGQALLAVARVDGPDWVFVHVYPRRLLANQGWDIARATLTLWLVALVACFVFLRWLMRHRVTGPLAALTGAMRDTADGHFDLRLDAHREDEVGQLGRAFNDMLGRLRERDQALRERAAELEREVGERRAHEALIERMRHQLATAAEAAFMGVWDVDLVTGSAEWDTQMYRLYGREREGFLPTQRDWLDTVHPDDRDTVRLRVQQAIAGEADYRDVEFRILWPDGTVRFLIAYGQVVRDADGRPLRIIGANVDVTDKKQAERRIVHMATHDALTGLANRALLYDRLEQALRQAERQHKPVAVMFLDLDRFKTINDSLGHTAGDALLVQVAERIESVLRRSDTLGRPGGDEFVAVLPMLDKPEDADVVAAKLLDALSQPFRVLSHELTSTPSIGISVYPHDGADPDTLIRNADAAMYRAKAAGRNTWRRYTPELSQEAGELLATETSLRHALERDEFVLHYQPKYDLRTGNVVGAEALIRWQRPGHGLLPPGRFIPVAEERGLIVPIGRWVMREVCRQQAAWRAAGYRPIPIALNLAAPHFGDPTLVEEISQLVATHRLDPSLLAAEVTESALLQDEHKVRANLRGLRDMGCGLALDDFGTGYSSLSYLNRFPLNELKIDRSFVHSIERDIEAPLVDAILSIGKALRLTVVAEGVETEWQHDYLVRRGCDQAQGFLYCRPVAAGVFEEMLLRDA